MTELLITLLMFVLGGSASGTDPDTERSSVARLILPPCPTEDSSWCHWDAQSQGNGQGTSFVTLSEGLTIIID